MRRDVPISASDIDAAPRLPERILAIDRYRGLLVILMVGGDYLSGVQLVPAALKHAPDIGFTIADTVASAFVFTVGLNYGPSFARRMQRGAGGAYRHFLLRYLALIGIGALIAAGGTSVEGTVTDWGVLQALGVAGLVCLPLIRLPTWARFASGALLLCGYQVLLDTWALDAVLGSVHGGFIGALAWSALLILSTAVADLWRAGSGPFAICCVVLVAVAAVALFIVPVSKHRVSLSFVLVTLAISALAFLLFLLAARIGPVRAGALCWWGENALALYVVHLMLLSFVVLPPATWWYAQAPVWLVVLQLSGILAIMTLLAWGMHRRRLRLGL